MARRVAILTIGCLCLIFFGMQDMSYGGSTMNPALMQKHIEEVKRTKPKKYQALAQRAEGKITNCSSCHKIEAMQRRGK